MAKAKLDGTLRTMITSLCKALDDDNVALIRVRLGRIQSALGRRFESYKTAISDELNDDQLARLKRLTSF